FPAIALEEADGWAFDIAESNAEQVLSLISGDALYVLTNENMFVMNDLSPNSDPVKVFSRGVIGRQASVWAEDALFWVAHDGIYAGVNRTQPKELSQEIRRLFRSWFNPDGTVCLGYQNRKLYALCGTRMLRYDFVKGRWSRHTLAHAHSFTACWRDPYG